MPYGLGNEADGTRTRNHRIDSRLVDEPVGDAKYGNIKQLADHDDSDDEPRAAESAAVDPWEAWMAGCPGTLEQALVEIARQMGKQPRTEERDRV